MSSSKISYVIHHPKFLKSSETRFLCLKTTHFILSSLIKILVVRSVQVDDVKLMMSDMHLDEPYLSMYLLMYWLVDNE